MPAVNNKLVFFASIAGKITRKQPRL